MTKKRSLRERLNDWLCAKGWHTWTAASTHVDWLGVSHAYRCMWCLVPKTEICAHNVKLGPGCFCPQCPTASFGACKHPETRDGICMVCYQRVAVEPSVPLVDTKRFEKAPCYLCGYNGEGYYQPKTHSCAEAYHMAVAALNLGGERG